MFERIVPKIVLLGDSIFDNAPYVNGGPDVLAHLQRQLPSTWRATLSAVDGSTTEDVAVQFATIPANATHLALSVGGNDALGHADMLERPADSVAEVLGMLAEVAMEFELRYRAAVDALLERRLPLAICTIYNGNFPDVLTQQLAATALTVFNDAILRVAIEAGLVVIDLRVVCTEPSDYANPIEPSVQGGAKIADAIVRALVSSPSGLRHATIVGA